MIQKNKHILPLLLALLLWGCATPEQPFGIIPRPVQSEPARGNLRLYGKLTVFYDDAAFGPQASLSPGQEASLGEVAVYLAGLFSRTAIETSVRPLPPCGSRRGITLGLDTEGLPEEGYRLEIGRRRILITGGSARGVFYGVQSLRQLLPPEMESPLTAAALREVRIPRGRILDYPAFEYRGMHLDVARHFFPVAFIKKYIDLMALHKMNHFHWHLTEDQGWRIEIKSHPRLTEIGAWRKETLVGHGGRPPFVFDGLPYGGYYSQEEIREVVDYAASRFVTVIPEIEMPGHATAALASYPSLGCTGGPYEVITRWGVFPEVFCAGKEEVFVFLEEVLAEVLELFPSERIHIGGDECPKTRWKECPLCQQRIAAEGLADEYELQSYFIRRIEAFLLSHGRTIVGWDEILEGGLAPHATVMSWRGTQGGIQAARMGHQAIMTPGSHCYFDHYQADPETQPLAIGGFTDLEKVYSYHPVPEELDGSEAGLILGAQGNVWTEYIKTPAHVEYMAYPRAVALAEVVWSPGASRDYADFLQRLKQHLKRLDFLDVNYFTPLD